MVSSRKSSMNSHFKRDLPDHIGQSSEVAFLKLAASLQLLNPQQSSE